MIFVIFFSYNIEPWTCFCMCQVELIGPPMGLAGMMGGGGGGMGHMDVDMYSGGGGGGGYPRGRSAGPPLANPSVFNMTPVNNNSFGLAMSGREDLVYNCSIRPYSRALVQLRIRIQHFKWIRIQSGSRVMMTKNRRKKIQQKIFLYIFFDQKLQFTCVQAKNEKPSALKREYPALQK